MQLRALHAQLVVAYGKRSASTHQPSACAPCRTSATSIASNTAPCPPYRSSTGKSSGVDKTGSPTNLHCDGAALGRAGAAAVCRPGRLANGDAQPVPTAVRMRCSLRAARAALARRPCTALHLRVYRSCASHCPRAADRRGYELAGQALTRTACCNESGNTKSRISFSEIVIMHRDVTTMYVEDAKMKRTCGVGTASALGACGAAAAGNGHAVALRGSAARARSRCRAAACAPDVA